MGSDEATGVNPDGESFYGGRCNGSLGSGHANGDPLMVPHMRVDALLEQRRVGE